MGELGERVENSVARAGVLERAKVVPNLPFYLALVLFLSAVAFPFITQRAFYLNILIFVVFQE